MVKQTKSLPAYHTMGCHWNAFFEAIFVVHKVFLKTKVSLDVDLKMVSTGPSCLYPLTFGAQLTCHRTGPFSPCCSHWEITAQIAVASSAAHLLFCSQELGVCFGKTNQNFACIPYYGVSLKRIFRGHFCGTQSFLENQS